MKTVIVQEILEKHVQWLIGGGRLVWADLTEDERMALRRANLSGANLSGADLTDAELEMF